MKGGGKTGAWSYPAPWGNDEVSQEPEFTANLEFL